MKSKPAVVEELTDKALLVRTGHVSPEVMLDGNDDGHVLAFRVICEGRFNKTRRKHTIPVVFDRGTLTAVLTDIAYRGALADRELASELHAAIDAGLERHRREAT